MRTRTIIGARASSSSSRTVYRDDDDDDEVVRSPLFCVSFVLFVFCPKTFFFCALNLRTPQHKNARLFARRRTTTTTERKAAQMMASPGEVRATPVFDPVRAFPRSRRLHFSSKRAAFFFLSKTCVFLHAKCNGARKREKISSVSND